MHTSYKMHTSSDNHKNSFSLSCLLQSPIIHHSDNIVNSAIMIGSVFSFGPAAWETGNFAWRLPVRDAFVLALLFISATSSANLEVVNITSRFCNNTVDDFSCGSLEYLGCTGTKTYYHESAIKLTWFEAWEYCRSLGLDLASIETRYEQAFIEIFLPPLGVATTETYWTSGNDFGKEGQFGWMATGKAMSYRRFRPGEPNNRFGQEHCVELVIKPETLGYLWNDRNCFAYGYAICQDDNRKSDAQRKMRARMTV